METKEEVNDHVEGVVPLKLERSSPHTFDEDIRSSKPTNAELIEETKTAVPVYIPGLHLSMEKKVKKRRKKKPKTQPGLRKTFNSSSESETKEKYANEVEFKDNFDEEWLNYVPEPINEINLTDDLAKSLLNPPTDDDFECSTIAKEIMNIVIMLKKLILQKIVVMPSMLQSNQRPRIQNLIRKIENLRIGHPITLHQHLRTKGHILEKKLRALF